MDVKREILDIPRALRETLEQGHPEYEALVRKTRWGDGPIYVVGSGPSFLVGLTATYAFEGLLGWPVVARPASVFASYALRALRPGSAVLALSHSSESEETMEAVRAARSHGAIVLAVTYNPASPLAQMSDGVFLFRSGGVSESGVGMIVCEQAALSYISLVAARVLKRHHPQLDVLEEEFEHLPQHVEWVLSQLSDAARSFASELKGPRHLNIVGAGFYHPTALLGALLMRSLAGIEAQGSEFCEFRDATLPTWGRDAVVAFLSGSRCRLRKEVQQLAASIKQTGAKIVSVTDSNDHELAARSSIALLLPSLTEMVGSTLTLVLLAWVAYQAGREQGGGSDRLGAKTQGKKGAAGDR